MTLSRHRLSLKARIPMETISPLDELEETYHHHDQAAGYAEAPSGDLHIPTLPRDPKPHP